MLMPTFVDLQGFTVNKKFIVKEMGLKNNIPKDGVPQKVRNTQIFHSAATPLRYLLYTHKSLMSDIVYEAIKPVYEQLTTDDLLTRCIGGFTQNSNESFNSTVWAMAPKIMNSGKIIIDIATNIASCHGHKNWSKKSRTMDLDEKRIQKAERSLSEGAKQARIDLKTIQKAKQEQEIDEEGQLYGAGIAD
ncbi:hypothetical protein G5I_08248 [Acromyrmex echinatior]|uniref:Uncharacterized protein n=1 Tax=Acromyrmex echinatior TaxID=103372 RepID=F4WR00_ACREC|nr:hypothetical protein G5I_08248 [Acromyrmex echinatior]